MAKLGNVLKDSQYLTRIKGNTSSITHPGHPRHHGIKMQAHHVISAEGVKMSGLSKELVQFGYNINYLPNLAFIPSTLQGACHLGVQPHRGNHTALVENDEQENDNNIEADYHLMVKRRVKELKRDLVGKCPGDDPKGPEKVCKKMNDISVEILSDIQDAPQQAPLTSIAGFFVPGNSAGCRGVDAIPGYGGGEASCPVHRNHLNQQGSGQRGESISYVKSGPYRLQLGK